jgi:hypothetical protein
MICVVQFVSGLHSRLCSAKKFTQTMIVCSDLQIVALKIGERERENIKLGMVTCKI